jgi:hypothetical protein
VIRQAITCDICASEKKQTNHWFVAYEQGGELRVSGWCSRNRQRPGAKHLCGQTCLHKLVDDFMARTIVRTPIAAEPVETEHLEVHATDTRPDKRLDKLDNRIDNRLDPRTDLRTDTSLTVQPNQHAVLDDFESSARLITPQEPAAVAAKSTYRAPAELVRMPGRGNSEERSLKPEEAPRTSSRNWRSEAWEREREREQRAAARLRSNG